MLEIQNEIMTTNSQTKIVEKLGFTYIKKSRKDTLTIQATVSGSKRV